MPYIIKHDREFFHPISEFESGMKTAGPGWLNFQITKLCDDYLKHEDRGKNYGNINEVIGVLECAKLEFYRRVAAPYEDTKIEANGDVYSEENLTK